MNYQVLLSALEPVARTAGQAILAVRNKGFKADYKADGSPVTEADEAAEAIILPALQCLAPDIIIISEENAASHCLAPPERFFLVDPLDGTKEFLRQDGQGAYTVNIALIEKGLPVLGVVFAPALDRMFMGAVGIGATENGQAITIRPKSNHPVAVASKSHRDQQTNDWLDRHKITQTTAIGSSLKFCLIAAGEADVYPRFGPTMEWDTAAGHAILRAAGGSVCNPDETPFTYGKADYRNGGFIAAGNWR